MANTKKQETAKKTTRPAAKKAAQSAAKAPARSPKKEPQKDTRAPERARTVRDENSILHRVLPGVFAVCAFLLAICFIFPTGLVANLTLVFFGFFGVSAWLIPLLLVYFSICWRRFVAEKQHVVKSVFACIVFLFAASLIHLFFAAFTGGASSALADVRNLWLLGNAYLGSGIIGGLLAVLLTLAFSNVIPGMLICLAGLLVFSTFLFGITPYSIWKYIKYYYADWASKRDEERERRKFLEEEREFEEETLIESDVVAPEDKTPFERGERFETAVPKENFDMNFADGEFDGEDEKEEEAADEDEAESGGTLIDTAPIYDKNGEIDLGAIFVDGGKSTSFEDLDAEDGGEAAELDIPAARESLTVTKEDEVHAEEPIEKPKPKPIEKAEYRFPPITLLSAPEKKKNEDVGAELRTNAQKLVETLASFRVNVKISSVSRGPTITRYELIPEAGTRVRAIANLVDDISLSLATSGIRIEAPIPGKAAVGIEVPNRTVSTVTLRELIENPAFTEAKSKLTVCLGKDVGGTPIMFDIAKMPHLLIAGATGMGKSVCINSIITSILYKATPDEVKLILIDPKKVEFNIYNGIPHLQIPVVSDPKKAAGALHWAVTEMERRYELIEEANTRKIEPYNEIARKRGMEVLPYTVIIIDELADLMMTAPDAVEDSICRLAQKARAAGMHIIIGTQRPSVDVITGLIKANIPSRIAFTVASQVDSRTIIDIAGAEKLIGRGDMLYYPVGLSKPMRAQGAFVSEDEVEKITEFVKASSGENEYDSDVMESIEREASLIGQSQKKSGGAEASLDDGAGDAKLRDALEIATDIGKISTSLLQRKLSIGYGRAAKIIDIMESRGFVSAPDGQKPREVLVTKTQFREMVVNDDERLK